MGGVDRISMHHKLFSNEVGYYFSRGVDCIRVALKYCIKNYNSSKILIPNYICSVVVDAALLEGFEIIYYDIDIHTLEPNFSEIDVKSQKGSVFLYCNYFGQLGDIQSASNFCEKNQMYMIEDLTHWVGKIEELPSGRYISLFQFNSLRKFLGTKDGAILSTKVRIDIEAIASEKKISMFNIGLEKLKHALKKITPFKKASNSQELMGYQYGYEEIDSVIFRLSPTYIKYLNKLLFKWSGIQNVHKWNEKKLSLEGLGFKPFKPLNIGDLPLYFVCSVAPEDYEKKMDELLLSGYQAHSWPAFHKSLTPSTMLNSSKFLRNSLIFIKL